MQLVTLLKKRTGIAFLLSLLAMLCGIAPAAHAAESWVGTGAPGEGGLVRGLYIVPNTSPTTLLAAVYGAGIFKSTDGGTSWAPSNSGLVNKRVRQVKGQPVAVPGGSPAWILAATEGGMYRSTDGGNTWSASNTGLQCLVVSNLDVFNSETSSAYGDANTVYAGTACATNSGVYKSIDGGVSWSKADWSSLSVSSAKVNSITVAGTPNFGQIIWASTDGQGLFRSADGGASWVRRNGTTNILSGPNGSGNGTYANAIRQGSGFVLVSVEGGGIYRSTDNGSNWFTLNAGLPTNPTILNGPISNVSGQQYVGVAGLGFYRNSISSTSTASWAFFAGPAQGLPEMVRSINTDPNTSTTWYATTIAGVYRSLDSGTSWSPIVSGIGGGYAHSSTTDPNNPNVVLGAADAMYRSTDGGATWVKSSAGLTDQPITPRFARGQANVALAGTADSGVFKTVDGGVNWSPSNSGLPAAANLVGQNARMRTDPIVNGLHYVTLEGQGVYKSADYGATWAAINNGLSGQGLVAMTLGIDPVNSSNLYLTTAGGYYRSTDGGATWSLMAGLPTSGIEQGVVHVDPNNPAVVYAAAFIPDTTAGAAANGGVWKTTNSGNTWTQVLNKLVHRVRVVGEAGYTTVYAAAWDDVGGGVLKSIDGGATWNPVNTGLNSIYIRQFETSAGDTRLLRASAIGGGIMNFANGVDAAVASLDLTLETFRNTVNSNSATLDFTHFAGNYDAGFLSDGENATADAKILAADLRGVTINSITITKVNSYDDASGILNVAATFQVTTPGGADTFFADGNEDGLFIFRRQPNGSYLAYGNQQIARTSAQVEMRTDYGPGGTQGPRQHVNFDIEAPQGTLSTTISSHSATASPNLWSGLLPQNLSGGTTRIETVQGSPAPAPVDTFTRDAFFGGFDPGATPVVNGTVFQYTLTKADLNTVTYSVPFSGTALNNPGTDAITGVTLNGGTATAFAPSVLSSPLSLVWALPTGFPIREVRLWGYVQNSINEQCSVSTDVILLAAATSGQVTLPSVCGANPIVRGGVNVTAEGLEGSGQRAMYIYNFDITGGVPAVPTGVTAIPFANGSIQINWIAASGATTYNVYMATQSGVTKTNYASLPGGHSHTGIAVTNYAHPAGAAPGTTYYIVVTAVNAQGESVESTQVSATIPASDGPAVTLSTSSIIFGSVGVGQTSAPVTVTVTNTGNATLSIINPSTGTAAFGFSGTTCNGANLAPLATCTVNVVFTPPFAGPHNDTLAINSNAPGSPHTAGLSGTGIAAAVLSTYGGTMSVEEGGTTTFGTYLLKADNTTQFINATWSGGSPAGINSSTGVFTVPPSVVTANTGAMVTATFTDATLTGGQTLTVNRAVIIQDGTDHWVGNGQPGQGGDVRQVLAINDAGATTLVALVYGRGVFRSVDGGASWLPANIGLGERQVRSVTLLQDGTNTKLVLATESGVYRSVTRGGSWMSSNTGLTCTSGRVIGRKDATSVYLGTNGCGVFKSTNGGMGWFPVNNGLPASTSVVSISVSSTSEFVAIGTAGAGFYQSLDGGASWSAANNGLGVGPHGVQVTRILTDPTFYLASVEGSGIFRSVDSGATWSAVTGAPTGAAYGPFQRVGTDIYVGADGVGNFKSSDNGVTWTEVTVNGVARRRNGPVPDPNATGTLYFATAAGVYKSVDSGSTWTKASSGLPGGFMHSSSTDPNDPNIVLATADTVYKSTDGGTTWAPANSGLTGHTAIAPGSINGNVNGGSFLRNAAGLFVSTTNHGVFKSNDNGATWSAANTGLPPAVGQGVLLRGDATNPSGLFATFSNYPSGAYRTADGGASWQSISGDLSGDALYVRFAAADPNAPGTLYAATRGGLYKSANGGTNWTLVAGTLTSSCAPNRVRVDAGTNPSTIYWSRNCGESNTSSGLYRSADGGSTSTQLLSSEPIFDVRVVRPSGVLTLWVSTWREPNYFATNNNLTWVGRIMRSTDGGSTWTGVSAGLLPGRPRSFEVDSATSQVVRLATSGTGLYTFVSSAPVGGGSVALDPGFNLTGNAANATIDVTTVFGNQDAPVTGVTSNVVSVWKWNAAGGRWAFHSPQLTVAGIAAYAAPRGFDVLTSIGPGEGYWVNAIGSMNLTVPSGTAYNWNSFSFASLPQGFNLIAHGTAVTPSQFNNNMSQTPPSPGVIPTDNFTTLWVWDAVAGTWYFYSPLLESTGGQAAVKAYADSHFFRHFPDYNKDLGNGVGFWVNRP